MRGRRGVAAGAALLAAALGCGHRTADRGWTVTVYYTAVQEFHHGPVREVTGCAVLDCRSGHADLGGYPGDFVDAVHDEGTGRITAGPHAGGYLNWSVDTGFWLDTAPRDAAGRPLRPFRTAAADAGVLPAGTRFTITGCGREDGGGPVDPAVCARLRAARWEVADEFTPGLGGPRHVDLYLGEETGPGFTEGPWYATLRGARLTRAGS